MAVVVAALVLAGGLLYWRGPIQASLSERYEAWKYASRFDRARSTLMHGRGTLWSPSPAGADADSFLNELLAASVSPATRYRGAGTNLVLFVRSGKTSGREWLAFACMSQTGLEVYSFDREDRRMTGYDRLLGTRQFGGLEQNKPGSLQLVAERVSEDGDQVTTVVIVNGGRNTLQWSIGAAPSVGRRSGMAFGSQLVVSQVTPQTGWQSKSDWWPNTSDVRLVEGSPPDKEVAAQIREALAISFVPDGRIALMATQRLSVATPWNDAVDVGTVAGGDRPETVAFSPDGLWCYVGGSSGGGFVISTLGGMGKPVGRSDETPKPFFLDDRTLIVHDKTRIRRIDCVTGVVTEEPKPAEGLRAFVRSRDVVAYMTDAKPMTIVVRRDQNVREMVDIQGRDPMFLSPDGKWLALRGQDGISVFDVETGVGVWEHNGNSDLDTFRLRIKWSRDGRLGAAAGNRFVHLWSTQDPKWVARFPHGRTGTWPDVAISDDGASMAASATGSDHAAYWSNITAATRPAR
ncbi:MAG TPA: hypothetical protein VGB55_09265 [Tepidisphaeraceae bacterium]